MRTVPSMYPSNPAMMVKCPVCSAEPGNKCYTMRVSVNIDNHVHQGRQDAYEVWKEGLSSGGFVRRGK